MMKLGTETASMTNHLYSRMTIGQPDAVVGMGATILSWTDRHACTIVKVDGPYVTVQQDKARRTDDNGMSECQSYLYETNPNGPEYTFRLSKSGGWFEVVWNDKTKRWNKINGHGLRIGERDHYHDFSF